MPVIAGRVFLPSDRLGSRPVVVVSRTLAERFFPGENPLGRSLLLPWGEGVDLTIIGVVGDLRDRGLGAEHFPVFYLPFRQFPADFLRMAVRVEGESTPMASAVRGVLHELDEDVPVFNVGTLEAQVTGSTASERFQVVLVSGFATIALLLASVGLFGVLSYLVSQRTRELGIRMALGASGSTVTLEVMKRGVAMAGVGIAVGLPGAVLAARLLGNQLFEIAPSDPATYLVVSVVFAIVTLTACVVPARRALRIDPVTALRAE